MSGCLRRTFPLAAAIRAEVQTDAVIQAIPMATLPLPKGPEEPSPALRIFELARKMGRPEDLAFIRRVAGEEPFPDTVTWLDPKADGELLDRLRGIEGFIDPLSTGFSSPFLRFSTD